ncbi:Tda3p RNJ42_01253 [Nakaseomyces bracarensis]|uniref:Tda3p n=1 Tax=Nakaseomyces bracarensis TaxID=273131 RepID=UPI0038721B21
MSADMEISTPDFQLYPSGNAAEKNHIVIVGAGIIGSCTAYYLTQHPDFDPSTHHITVLESREVAGGASGKAGGLLASWAFPQQIVPLSFQLHQELSDMYDGAKNWDYRRLTTVSLEADLKLAEQHIPLYEDNNGVISEGKKAYSLDVPPPKKAAFKKKEKNKSKGKNFSLAGSSSEEEDSSDSDHGEKKPNHKDMNGKKDATLSKNEDDDEDDEADNSSIISGGGGPNIKDEVAMNSGDESSDEATGRTLGNMSTNPGSSIYFNSQNIKTQLPRDLTWVRNDIVTDWSSLGGTDSTAQVHPHKFTHYLLQKAMETGAVELIRGKVINISVDDTGSATGITYIPTKWSREDQMKEEREANENEGHSASEKQRRHSDKVPIHITDIHQLVLSMGPWTSKLLKNCPISGLRAHSITIRPSSGPSPQGKRKNMGNKPTIENYVSPYAIFTELKTGDNEYFSPELYARRDEVYVCGEGDTLVGLPETSDEVQIVEEKCDQLYHYVSKLSPVLSEGEILTKQACYLPVLNVPTSSGPLIGETNIKNLFVASGHSCWGINNAPATGKILSEILLEGEANSAEISALDPKLYFDASIH